MPITRVGVTVSVTIRNDLRSNVRGARSGRLVRGSCLSTGRVNWLGVGRYRPTLTQGVGTRSGGAGYHCIWGSAWIWVTIWIWEPIRVWGIICTRGLIRIRRIVWIWGIGARIFIIPFHHERFESWYFGRHVSILFSRLASAWYLSFSAFHDQ